MRIWKQASNLSAETPDTRNRYVDFLRAVSILVVVIGHWLISTVYYVGGGLEFVHLFPVSPASHPSVSEIVPERASLGLFSVS